jgi:hypothetical protein
VRMPGCLIDNKARPTSLFQVFFSTNILVNKECHNLDKSGET